MIKLFVVGFPREMDELQLAQLFGPYGDIQLLTIAREKESGKSKGFGFIQMDDEGARDAISALDGYTFGERLLEVRIAEDNQLSSPKLSFKPKPNFSPAAAHPVRKKRPRITR